MKLRSARHTTDLQRIIAFYCGNLDLEIIGEFHNHNDYDGVMLGVRNSDWHLEFTVSTEIPKHRPDDDDLLVFYAESDAEFDHIKENFRLNNVNEINNKNPYWIHNGVTYMDPDGFRIVITKIKTNE